MGVGLLECFSVAWILFGCFFCSSNLLEGVVMVLLRCCCFSRLINQSSSKEKAALIDAQRKLKDFMKRTKATIHSLECKLEELRYETCFGKAKRKCLKVMFFSWISGFSEVYSHKIAYLFMPLVLPTAFALWALLLAMLGLFRFF